MRPSLRQFGTELSVNRVSGCELSPVQRAAICGAVSAGASVSQVAEAFRVASRTVQRTVQLWNIRHSFDSDTRNGRPEKLSRRHKRYIMRLLKKKTKKMAIKALVSEVDGGVSYSTIRRCLRLHKMRKWRLDAADAASKCTCVIFVGDVGSVLCIYGGEVRVVVGTVLR